MYARNSSAVDDLVVSRAGHTQSPVHPLPSNTNTRSKHAHGHTHKHPQNHTQVCEGALLCALGSADLSFALRMCQYVDDEGIVIDQDVRDALLRTVGHAIRKLPDTAAVNTGGGGGGGIDDLSGAAATGAQDEESEGFEGEGEWKVEGTNATVEELWNLDALLQRCALVGWFADCWGGSGWSVLGAFWRLVFSTLLRV